MRQLWRNLNQDPATYTRFDRVLLRAGLIVIIAACIVGAITMRNFGDAVFEIQDFQKEGRERAYIQRAITCQVLGAQVLQKELPEDCLDENITKYYDPDNLPITRSEIAANRNAVVYCGFLKEQESVVASQEPCRTLLK